jgi:pyrimidine-nucleoside phosphorylase
MISGRGLGATGGTLDKLEAIPGFRTNLTMTKCRHRRASAASSPAPTADLVPADRKLYALRDVTATVPSIPLITASIMSKKLAEGLDALVLDVKWGTGAFMKTADQARELARSLVARANAWTSPRRRCVTDMNQPLGRLAGNAVEVDESVAMLEASAPADLVDVTLELGAEILVSVKQAPTIEAARANLQQTIDSGVAREKFAEMVRAQGGNIDAPRAVAPASEIPSPKSGYLAAIDAEQLGRAIIAMGGGRQQLGDKLDHSTGIEMLVRIGDRVEAGQPLVRVFAKPDVAQRVRPTLQAALQLSDDKPTVNPLILDRVV